MMSSAEAAVRPAAGLPPRGRWHLLTGEYPPQPGGVSDYSYLVAAGLAAEGSDVHVWAPAATAGPTPAAGGVTVHREAGSWSPDDLRRLGDRLDAFEAPRRLLVQYTPNAWGRRGTNLAFCRWLAGRGGRGDRVVTMIHESAYPWRLFDRPTRLALAVVHRLMLRTLLGASERVYYSTGCIEGRLRFYCPAPRPLRLLPVPSNVPVDDDPVAVAAVRARYAPDGRALVGQFGTYGEGPRRILRRVLPPLLLGHPGRVGLLMGRNGEPFAEELRATFPGLAGRLHATGGLPPRELSHHLQACDVLALPYEDGVSTRRGTVMAALAHGRPIATNIGYNSEPVWSEARGVAAGPAGPAIPAIVDGLLADPEARRRLGAAARELYDREFAVGRTVEAILADDWAAARGPR